MYRAKPNHDGSVGFESVAPGYKARAGEVLFADPPSESQLDEAFPGRRKPVAPPPPDASPLPDVLAEIAALSRRLAELEATVAALAAAKDA